MKKTEIVVCSNCTVEFSKSVSEIKRSVNHYCSRRCSALKNNKNSSIRRKPEGFCKVCKAVLSKTRVYCNQCLSDNHILNMTLGQVIYKSGQASNRYGRIREHARRFAVSNNMSICSHCGWDKFVHICHIKAIADWSLDSKVSEINALSNLIALCPNCHWIHDHEV